MLGWLVVTLKNSVPAVTGEAGREAGHGDPDGDAQGAGQGEHQVGGDEAPLAEAGLRHVQAEAEGHQRLVTKIMTEPLHLLQGFLNLVAKNFCTWGTCLARDKGEEENLDVMFLPLSC